MSERTRVPTDEELEFAIKWLRLPRERRRYLDLLEKFKYLDSFLPRFKTDEYKAVYLLGFIRGIIEAALKF